MNESNRDRIARVLVGGGLLALGAFTLSGAGAIAAIAVGVILVGTGAVGFCPIYAIFRTGTKSTDPVS
ncbi:MAG: YgaP-like transmembrane domain [Acidimicrobiia bacterium]